MSRTLKNALVWIAVILLETIILAISGNSKLWIYIALPIIAAFYYTELYTPRPKKTRRNLR